MLVKVVVLEVSKILVTSDEVEIDGDDVTTKGDVTIDVELVSVKLAVSVAKELRFVEVVVCKVVDVEKKVF